jgi:hypothetical protein
VLEPDEVLFRRVRSNGYRYILTRFQAKQAPDRRIGEVLLHRSGVPIVHREGGTHESLDSP